MRFRFAPLAFLLPLILTAAAQAGERPNILFAIADDWSWPHASAYGDKVISTPSFDRVAENGVLFHNVFCAAPQCAPNRASILTGRNIWENEEAGTHAANFPSKLKVFTDLLTEAGYFTGYTGKAWGPATGRSPAGSKTRRDEISATMKPRGFPRGYAPTTIRKILKHSSRNGPPILPFVFGTGCYEPHRKFEDGIGKKNGLDPESVEVPGFLPDHPTIRSDLADYYYEIQWFDRHLGEMLDLLEKKGELDNTLVVVTSDNGMAFPRAKANLYEYGLHMPLAVMWPDQVSGGREIEDLVAFIDFAPTFLEAAGLPRNRP